MRRDESVLSHDAASTSPAPAACAYCCRSQTQFTIFICTAPCPVGLGEKLLVPASAAAVVNSANDVARPTTLVRYAHCRMPSPLTLLHLMSILSRFRGLTAAAAPLTATSMAPSFNRSSCRTDGNLQPPPQRFTSFARTSAVACVARNFCLGCQEHTKYCAPPLKLETIAV